MNSIKKDSLLMKRSKERIDAKQQTFSSSTAVKVTVMVV
jgi:hypothetical protein